MKPLKLEFEAFLSYKDKTVIDFTNFNNRIFLIDGDTGAGKTTIFDAMCFALYGEASDTSRDTHFKSHFASEETISYVDFTFEEEGKIYNIYRQPRQLLKSKKRNAEGYYPLIDRSEEVKLELGNQKVLTKTKECNQKIIEIIKLKQDQFRNTVMIGQNKFADLIRTTTQNRKELFRSILQTAKFATFKDMINEKYTNAYHEIENEAVSIDTILKNYKATSLELIEKLNIEHPSDIDSELLNSLLVLDISSLKAQLDAKEMAYKELNLNLDKLKEEYLNGEKNNQNLNNYIIHKNSYFEEQKKEDEFKKKKEIVDIYRDSLDTYNSYKMYLDKKNTITEKTKQISINKELRTILEPKLACALENKQKTIQLTNENNNLRLSKQTLETLVETSKELDKKLDNELTLKETIQYNKNCNSTLRVTLEESKKIIENLKKFNEENGNVNVELTKKDTAISELNKSILNTGEIYQNYSENLKNLENIKINIKKEEENKESLDAQISKTNFLIEKNKNIVEDNKNISLELFKIDNDINLLDEKIKNINIIKLDYENLNNLKEDLKNKLENISVLSNKYNEKNNEYQKLNIEYKCNLAGILASTLNEGEVCPVCGNTHHIKLAQKTTNVDEDTLNKTLKELNNISNSLAKGNATYDALIKSYDEKKESVFNALKELTDLDASNNRVEEIIENYIKLQTNEKLKLVEKKNELNEKTILLQNSNNELEKLSLEKEELDKKLNQTIKNEAIFRENYKNFNEKNEECFKKISEVLPDVTLDNISNIYNSFLHDANNKLLELEKEKLKLQEIVLKVNTNQEQIKTLEISIETLKIKIEEINTKITTDETNLKLVLETINSLKTKLNGQTKDVLDKNILDLTSKIKENEAIISKYNEEVETINNQKITIDNTIKNLEQEVSNLVKESSNLENEYMTKLSNTILKDINKIVEFVTSKKDLINRYDEEYTIYIQKLTYVKSLYEEDLKNGFDKLVAKDLSKNENEQVLIKNSILELTKEVDLIKSMYSNNNQIITQYNEKIETIKSKNKNVSDLKKLYLVASGQVAGQEKIDFETYYQSQIFNNILVEANKKLSVMTDNVYTMIRHESSEDQYKVSTALDIDIFDTFTGKVRSANSLSGGETFMASLSLALGFSEISRNNSGAHELDCMFIDEGFGTLDEETLRTVMKVLNQLSNEANRTIGIISHVSELKDVIAKQMHVTKDKINGSKIEFKM